MTSSIGQERSWDCWNKVHCWCCACTWICSYPSLSSSSLWSPHDHFAFLDPRRCAFGNRYMGPKPSPARILIPFGSRYPSGYYLVSEVDYIKEKIILKILEIYIYGNKSPFCRCCGGFALDTIEKGHKVKRDQVIIKWLPFLHMSEKRPIWLTMEKVTRRENLNLRGKPEVSPWTADVYNMQSL